MGRVLAVGQYDLHRPRDALRVLSHEDDALARFDVGVEAPPEGSRLVEAHGMHEADGGPSLDAVDEDAG